MKRRILQVIVFGIIVGGGWVALSPVRARLGAAQPLVKSISIAGPQGGKQLLPGGPIPAGRIQLTQNVRAYANITAYAVELGPDRQAIVSASVALGDQEPDYLYKWVLRIKSEDNKTLQTFPYDQQLFEVASVREMTPTFHEVVTVPQGKSWVRLSLYRFPKSTDPAVLADETRAEAFSILSAPQAVDAP